MSRPKIRAATAPGPVGLLDMGDNVGGGGPGDSTVLAHELIRRGCGPAVVVLNDPDAVAVASSTCLPAALDALTAKT